jgi:hypothetical protein
MSWYSEFKRRRLKQKKERKEAQETIDSILESIIHSLASDDGARWEVTVEDGVPSLLKNMHGPEFHILIHKPVNSTFISIIVTERFEDGWDDLPLLGKRKRDMLVACKDWMKRNEIYPEDITKAKWRRVDAALLERS